MKINKKIKLTTDKTRDIVDRIKYKLGEFETTGIVGKIKRPKYQGLAK